MKNGMRSQPKDGTISWLWRGVGLLVVGLLLVGSGLYWAGRVRMTRVYDFPASSLVIPADAASIARGRHLAQILCAGCHGLDLGGVPGWFEAEPLGRIDTPNLTSGQGGIGAGYRVEDYVRALRHGINRQGRPIFMTGVLATSQLSDPDLAAIIAYLKTIPPVDRQGNGVKLTALAHGLLAAGVLGDIPVEVISHQTQVAAVPAGVSQAYGEYLVNIADCRVCHGQALAGGRHPDPTIPNISPNLTPGGELGFWSEAQFIETMRGGVTPSGYPLNSRLMPWKDYARFDERELRAIFLFLQAQPKLPQYTE